MAKILRCTSMGNQWHAVLMNKQQDLGGGFVWVKKKEKLTTFLKTF